ncbi:MAG: MerR family transcriptional regulator [Blastocatellia bacterium]|jgi:DNA-binding transcriptional MerR regulator|nr:MerR family transcriptional regulator [Blastocatellia bacterium]
MHPAKVIPDKLFFKIGEVCELIEVQPHVLRYWESEFPMLAPQKNRAGQRTYRRKDVEMVMRIKQLLYEEGFTIAGAKKKLATESRTGAKLKVVTPEMAQEVREQRSNVHTQVPQQVTELPLSLVTPSSATSASNTTLNTFTANTKRLPLSDEQRLLVRKIKEELRGLLTLLSADEIIGK